MSLYSVHKFIKRIVLLFLIFLPFIGYAQLVQFNRDSIPVIEGKVVFNVSFKSGLNKIEFHKRVDSFFNRGLHPYSGGLIIDNDNYTICEVTDYIDVVKSFFQNFGMYMTYRLDFKYMDSICIMSIHDISYMEKEYYEEKERSKRELKMPVYTANDIMIDHKYSLMFIRKASERITKASIERINEIIKGLNASFVGGKGS